MKRLLPIALSICCLSSCQLLLFDPTISELNSKVESARINNGGGNSTDTNKIINGGSNPNDTNKIINGGSNPNDTNKISNGGNNPTDTNKINLQQQIQQQLQAIEQVSIPTNLSVNEAQNIELGQVVVPSGIQSNIQNLVDSKQQFQVELEGQVVIPSNVVIPSSVVIPSNVVIPSGFTIARTPFDAYKVEVINPAGLIIASAIINHKSTFSFQNLPGGMRLWIRAHHLSFPEVEVSALIDVPEQMNVKLEQNLTSQTQALTRVMHSAKKNGVLPVDRIPIDQAKGLFNKEIEAVQIWESLKLNQLLIQALGDNKKKQEVNHFLSYTRTQRVFEVLKSALKVRERVLEQPEIANLSDSILTSPVVFNTRPENQSNSGDESSEQTTQQSSLTLSLLKPVDGEVFNIEQEIEVEALMENTTSQFIDRIEFYSNEQLVQTVAWDISEDKIRRGRARMVLARQHILPGELNLKAIARGKDNQFLAESQIVTVRVNAL